jgi:hypothetical protein
MPLPFPKEEKPSVERARLKVSGGRPAPEFQSYYIFGWSPVPKTKAAIWQGPLESVEPMRRMFEGFGYTVSEVK